MLRTGSLSGVERDKFFELIFTKYVDDNLHDLRKRINDFERATFGNFNFNSLEAICDYEMDGRRLAPALRINFLELGRYTYSGLAENGINGLINKLLSEPSTVISTYREGVETRIVYLKSMLDLIEHNLLSEGKISKPGDKHPETEKAYAALKEFEDLKVQVTRLFVPRHKRVFECALRLQEIERRRANRIYEEERIRLGKILMK